MTNEFKRIFKLRKATGHYYHQLSIRKNVMKTRFWKEKMILSHSKPILAFSLNLIPNYKIHLSCYYFSTTNYNNQDPRKEWQDRHKQTKKDHEKKDYDYSRKSSGMKKRISLNMKNHYETLGISPEASQKEIKTAYYEQSKLYHPDVNPTETAKESFRQASDAYSVLGNKDDREQYDQQLFGRKTERTGIDPFYWRSEEDEKRARGFTKRETVNPETGKTKYYDYHEHYRMHYEEYKKREEEKLRKEWEQQLRYDEYKSQQHRMAVGILVTMAMITAIIEIIEIIINSKYKKKRR